MREYKTDQDRFLDLWLDLADFREAETREQLAEAKSRVDNAVKAVMKGNHSLLVASEAEAREWMISELKKRNKLPADFIYPERD